MNEYKLTVIIPTFNQAQNIHIGLDSVPEDPRIEIIIVDDGSTDSTYKTICEYQKAHPKKAIRIFRLPKNKGVSTALNKGLDNARGEYIVLLGSDGDYFYTGALSKAIDQWFDGTDLIYFDMIDNRGDRRRLTPDTRDKHTGSVKFMRRAFIGDTRNPTDYRRGEDNMFIASLVAKNPTEKFTYEVIKHYNYPREGSLSWNAYHGITDKKGQPIMNIEKKDIVYCLKNSLNNEELRYSLRSLKNLPHREVWMVGGMPPQWVKGVHYIPFENNCETKWDNTRQALQIVCETKGISSDFIWFNDDFYVLQPIQDLRYHYDRTLSERANETISQKTHTMSKYGHRLMQAQMELIQHNKPFKNFELHCPIIYNKKKMLACLKKYPHSVLPRSLYCNEYNIDALQNGDYKIEDLQKTISAGSPFASTSDNSFRSGEIGRQIRGIFPLPSEYEDKWSGLSKPPMFGHNRDLRFL